MKKGLLVGVLVLNSAALSGCKEDKKAPADLSAQPLTPISAVVVPASLKPPIVQRHSSSSADNCSENRQSQPTAPAVAPEEKDYLIARKSSHYLKAANEFGIDVIGVLDGTSNWPYNDRKLKADIEKKDYRVVRSVWYFTSRRHAHLLENLKNALNDKEIQLPNLDGIAEGLVVALDKLVPVWQKLEQYNKTKQFEEDNGALGKELMETFIPAYYEVEKRYEVFVASVFEVAVEMKKKRMACYKQEGRLLELYNEESIELALGIFRQFRSTEDFKKKEKLEIASALLAQLEEKLVLQMTEYRKAKREGKNPNVYYSYINQRLSRFISNYRKATKDPNTMTDEIFDEFYYAIDLYNHI